MQKPSLSFQCNAIIPHHNGTPRIRSRLKFVVRSHRAVWIMMPRPSLATVILMQSPWRLPSSTNRCLRVRLRRATRRVGSTSLPRSESSLAVLPGSPRPHRLLPFQPPARYARVAQLAVCPLRVLVLALGLIARPHARLQLHRRRPHTRRICFLHALRLRLLSWLRASPALRSRRFCGVCASTRVSALHGRDPPLSPGGRGRV